jgi:hypothetical protein
MIEVTMKLLTRLALLTLFLIGMALPATAQYTTVTIASGVQDSSGILYVNGKYNVTLVNSTGQVPYFQGTPLPTSLQSYSGTLTTSGTVSGLIIPATTSILSGQGGPVSQMTWNFSFTASNGVSGGFSVSTAITGSTQDISATVNAASPRLIFPISNPPLGPTGAGLLANGSGFSYGAASGSVGNGAVPANAVYASPTCPVANTGNCYFVNFNTKVITDATTANTGQTIDCSFSNDCNFTSADIGKTEFTINNAAGTIATPEGTIQSITDAQHAVVTVASTQTLTHTGYFAWGTPDVTTAGTGPLVTAFAAAAGVGSKCATLFLPVGVTLVEGAVFTSTPGCPLPFVQGNASPLPAVIGDPARGTIIVPTPNFTWTTCGTFCFAPNNSFILHKDWMLEGLGYNGAGYTTGTKNISSGWSIEYTLDNWCYSCSNVNGMVFASQGQSAWDDDFNQVGNASCYANAGNNIGPLNLYCSSINGPGMSIASGSVMTIQSTFNSTNAAGAVNVSGGTWYSFSDSTNGQAAFAGCVAATGGTMFLDGTNCFSSTNAAIVVNGGKAYLHNTTAHITGGSGTWMGCFANCATAGEGIWDQGGNNAVGPGTYSLSTVPVYGSGLSANQTQLTIAKVVLSSGWGTGNAVSAPLGATFPVTFTITNGSAAVGASPTITYTFPTPLLVAPISCTATDAGGTNPLLNPFTTSSLTTTGAVFTATGTPTISDTELMQVTCVTY